MISLQIETELWDGYQRQLVCYARVRELCPALVESLSRGEDGTEALGRIGAVLADIAVIESEIAAAKSAWLEQQGSPGGRVSVLLGQVSELIRDVQVRIEAAPVEGMRQKALLAPELDDLARWRQGQRMYSANSAGGAS